MPPYHTQIPFSRSLGNLPLLPLRSTVKSSNRGPAPSSDTPTTPDIIDESLDLFKANILFTTFEIKEKSDLVLVYITLYVVLCLKRLAKCVNKERGGQEMFSLALERFAIPGDADFPLNAFYERPKNAQEADEMKRYLTQIRSEVGARLNERVFDPSLSPDGKPSKWWVCFARKKFLKVELSG